MDLMIWGDCCDSVAPSGKMITFFPIGDAGEAHSICVLSSLSDVIMGLELMGTLVTGVLVTSGFSPFADRNEVSLSSSFIERAAITTGCSKSEGSRFPRFKFPRFRIGKLFDWHNS